MTNKVSLAYLVKIGVALAIAGLLVATCRRATVGDLYTTAPARLHQAPDESSEVIQHLPPGTALFDAGEVSSCLVGIYLKDSLRWEPWLRVRTADGATGWVFGGAAYPSALGPEDAWRWRCQKRLQALIGVSNARRLLEWAQATPRTDTALAHHLRIGLILCDTLQRALRYGIRRAGAADEPDLRWLNAYLRYFRRYRGGIALDYARLTQVARQTAGAQDDVFAHLGCEVFPLDSMASPLPAWVFPLSWVESASNLGAGHHLLALQRVEQALQRAPLFRPETERLKQLLLDDILNSERTYWQPLPRLLAELDSILAEPFHCLSEQERAALLVRRAMLERGLVRTDLRSGR